MSRPGRLGRAVLVAALVLAAVVSVPSARADESGSSTSGTGGPARLVSVAPAGWTPQVEDGRVLTIAEVGDRVVVGGTFTSVDPVGGEPTDRSRLAVFGSDGTLDDIAPVLDGDVEKVIAGPVPGTAIVAGSFDTIDGVHRPGLALLDLTDGTVVSSFAPPAIDGTVYDVAVTGSRLLVGGTFTTVGGEPRAGLASLDPTTGALDSYLMVALTEHHNWTPECTTCAKGDVGVTAFAVSPDATTLAVVGNFRLADNVARDQVALIDLTATTAAIRADWNTNAFAAACLPDRFDSYVRDVAYSPDGAYFAVAASGGRQIDSTCDTVTRFEQGAAGNAVTPTWRAVSGGDTFLSVAVDDGVVYAGGHGRWVNNDLGRGGAGAGAVARASLVALDAGTGLPLSWNPGRNPRGYGVTALSMGSQGLWAGSDTDWIGNKDGSRSWFRPRLALFPRTGAVLPAGRTPGLPGTVLLAGNGKHLPTMLSRRFDGATASTDRIAPAGSVPWSEVRGAVQIDDTLYVGKRDGIGRWMLWSATFDGRSFGPLSVVDPYRDPYWCAVSTGSGSTFYCGALPDFYAQLAQVTALAYRDGRLYYALAGSPVLRYRTFAPESGVVGAVEQTVIGRIPAGTPALLLSGSTLYSVDRATGRVQRQTLGGAALSGSPVVVRGATSAAGWNAKAVFLADWRAASDPVLAAPSAPRATSARVNRRGAAVVRWAPARTHGAAVTRYRVQTRVVGKAKGKWRTTVAVPGTKSVGRWRKVPAGQVLRVRIVAVSEVGSTIGRARPLRDARRGGHSR